MYDSGGDGGSSSKQQRLWQRERERASHGDYSESRWQLQGNVLSQSHLLCDLPRDIELAAAAAGAVASIWPHSLLQLRRVDKSATATT